MQVIERVGLEQAQRNLLPKKDSGLRGGDIQCEFIDTAAHGGMRFCDYVRGWGETSGPHPQVTEYPMTEREFLDPPWTTERSIAATWNNLSSELAARPETWTRIHVEMIEQERIKSAYLAGEVSGEDGLARIRKSLKSGDPDQIDSCVRAILRRLGGVVADRANRTAFLDCPLARAWWRNRYAQESHAKFPLTPLEAASNALRPAYRWSTLVEAMVSRLTIMGDSAIRPALVQALAKGHVNSKHEMQDMLDFLGRRSTYQALGFVGSTFVLRLIEEHFKPSRQASE